MYLYIHNNLLLLYHITGHVHVHMASFSHINFRPSPKGVLTSPGVMCKSDNFLVVQITHMMDAKLHVCKVLIALIHIVRSYIQGLYAL